MDLRSLVPNQSVFLFCVVLVVVCASCFPVHAAKYKPIELHPEYNHDRFKTVPYDIDQDFRAFFVSFDSRDDDDGDGQPDYRRIPEFVAYQIKKYEGILGKGPKRPNPWITDRELYAKGIAPSDASYRYSKAFRSNRKNWYDRGHLCAKFIAWRLGPNADWNTHTMLNAVPQRHNFNAGIWLDMEEKTAQWADKYNNVWIITGPVFMNRSPTKWVGERSKGDKLVAVPDGLFKIVIKDSTNDNEIDVLAFFYPQLDRGYKKSPYDHSNYLVSVDWIEKRTGLDFFTALNDDYEKEIEKVKIRPLWE